MLMELKKILQNFLTILILGFLGHLSFAAVPQAPPQDELLVKRINGFWQAWRLNQTSKLLPFVVPDDRGAFAAMTRFELIDYGVESITFSVDEKKALVRTKIKRHFPLSNNPVEWTLEHEWVMQQGNWYLKYQQEPAEGLFKQKGLRVLNFEGKTPPVDRSLGPVVFRETRYDFGSVPAGTPLAHEFEFENTGADQVRITFVDPGCPRNAPEKECIAFQSPKTVYPTHTKGAITLNLPDTSKPRKVDDKVTIYFNNGQEVPLHFVADITASSAPKP